jgi:hypothetical protein
MPSTVSSNKSHEPALARRPPDAETRDGRAATRMAYRAPSALDRPRLGTLVLVQGRRSAARVTGGPPVGSADGRWGMELPARPRSHAQILSYHHRRLGRAPRVRQRERPTRHRSPARQGSWAGVLHHAPTVAHATLAAPSLTRRASSRNLDQRATACKAPRQGWHCGICKESCRVRIPPSPPNLNYTKNDPHRRRLRRRPREQEARQGIRARDALNAVDRNGWYFWTGNGKPVTAVAHWQKALQSLF